MEAIFPRTSKRAVCTLIPYAFNEGEPVFFLQKRSISQTQSGRIGIFGGGIEEGESLEEALVREIREELSIEVSGYELFSTYEFPKHINNLFILRTTPEFGDTVTVLEGDWGKFFTEKEVEENPDILSGTRLIIFHVAEYLKGQLA